MQSKSLIKLSRDKMIVDIDKAGFGMEMMDLKP
jgi:hypothetical protein